MLLRTAKSCGPDAPTLASSLRRHVGPTGLRQPISANDGGKQARSPGRARRKPLKPLRAGMPGDPGGPVATTRVHYQLRTRGYGCSGHPAFPTPSMGREIVHNSGASRREGKRVFAVRRSNPLSSSLRKQGPIATGVRWDGRPRPLCTERKGTAYGSLLSQGRRASGVPRIRATRWLAMTVLR